jgi:hypothetical protein
MTGSNGSVVRACENMVTNTGTRVSIGGRRVTRSVQSDIECQQGRQCSAKAVAADGYARRGSRIEITLDRVLRRGGNEDFAALIESAKPYAKAAAGGGFGSFGSERGEGFSENRWPEPKLIPDGLLPVAAFDPAFLPEAVTKTLALPLSLPLHGRPNCS